MTSVLHVIDSACDQTQWQVLALLCTRLAGQGITRSVCFVGDQCARLAHPLRGPDVVHIPQRFSPVSNWAPGLGQAARQVGAQVVHAWGVQAARSARENLRDLPLVLTLLDPAATRDAARWVRAMPVGTTVAAGSQIIRTRLIRSGISLDRVVVIRGGVDFGAINTARESDHRERLVGDGGPVILMLGPASRGGGQYYGLWAAAIVAQIHRKLRIILPYGGSEAERLNRFVRQIKMPELMVTDATRTWPELLAAADVLLCPAIDEVCTEPIAWAMASGVAVVGCAVRSVCEMIADKHNGLLCKPKAPRSLAGRILTALEDGELRRRITEAARGQAYEVFSVRAMADNYLRLYENVLAGRPAAEGITDTAMVA